MIIIMTILLDGKIISTKILLGLAEKVNQLEENLEAITRTIEQLKRDGCSDEKILNELREERDKILKDLNL